MLDRYGHFRGLVRLAHYDALGRAVGPLAALKPNLITVGACEAMARLLGGDPAYAIKAVYFEFENTAGAPAAVAYDRTTTIADFSGLGVGKGAVRAALAAGAAIETGDSSVSGLPYANNRATFFALATATVGIDGTTPFSAAANSKIVSIGLAAAPVQADPTRDLLYARFTPASPFAVEAGRLPGVTWTVEML